MQACIIKQNSPRKMYTQTGDDVSLKWCKLRLARLYFCFEMNNEKTQETGVHLWRLWCARAGFGNVRVDAVVTLPWSASSLSRSTWPPELSLKTYLVSGVRVRNMLRWLSMERRCSWVRHVSSQVSVTSTHHLAGQEKRYLCVIDSHKIS
jgi:hypothetical protein